MRQFRSLNNFITVIFCAGAGHRSPLLRWQSPGNTLHPSPSPYAPHTSSSPRARSGTQETNTCLPHSTCLIISCFFFLFDHGLHFPFLFLSKYMGPEKIWKSNKVLFIIVADGVNNKKENVIMKGERGRTVMLLCFYFSRIFLYQINTRQ
jgi:hypothetical protein